MNKLSDSTLQAIIIERLKTSIGDVALCSISKRDGSEIISNWDCLQKAKNELFGHDATGVEVYPKAKKVVNRMNMRHLWIMPDEYVMPFGISEGQVGWRFERGRLEVKMYVHLTYNIVVNLKTSIGSVTLCSIAKNDGSEIVSNWDYLQSIKNELFGKDATAVEVYPSMDKLINSRNTRHIWVLPNGYKLPFGLGADLMNIIAKDVVAEFDQIIGSHRTVRL